MIPSIFDFAQTDVPSGGIYVGASVLVAIGLGFVLRAYLVVRGAIANLEDHVDRCEDDNKELRHVLSWERTRVSYLARLAGRSGLPLPLTFWMEPGPVDSPFPVLPEEER